jgi:hypothetical protein
MEIKSKPTKEVRFRTLEMKIEEKLKICNTGTVKRERKGL